MGTYMLAVRSSGTARQAAKVDHDDEDAQRLHMRKRRGNHCGDTVEDDYPVRAIA